MSIATFTVDEAKTALNEAIDPLVGKMVRLESEMKEAQDKLRPASERAKDAISKLIWDHYNQFNN